MPRRPVILEGERVFLSPPTKEDVELLLESINDKEVTQYLNLFPRIMTREMEERWLDNILNGREKDLFFFSIILKENGSLIGNSSLKVDFFNRTGRLGISLWRKDLWGRGLGRESVILTLDYGFNVLSLDVISLDVMEFNERAINCYKSVGFKEVGRKRCRILRGSKKYDLIEMDMLRDEFNEMHESKVMEICSDSIRS
ncbi:MAG TPA: N-acetyltransferase [Euryarchaeota archaeon]|nr:MAG: N-acetyltransferase [Thermococci archaeon]HDI10630.1 N-acetyltransferase [Euryarchaeota archaeon]